MNKSIRPTVYDSAIDWWVAALILLTPALAAGIGIRLLVDGNADGAMWLFLIGAGSLLLTLAFTLPCRYTILDDALSIRCGLLFFQISLRDIESVEPSHSWLNGPALSLHRVRIVTRQRSVLVSPRHRDRFIADLQRSIHAVRPPASASDDAGLD